MKRINLKGLRISSRSRERQAPGQSDSHDHSRIQTDSDGEESRRSSDISRHKSPEKSANIKRKGKKGFLKSLRRRITSNLQRKRDSSVSDDECGDQNRQIDSYCGKHEYEQCECNTYERPSHNSNGVSTCRCSGAGEYTPLFTGSPKVYKQQATNAVDSKESSTVDLGETEKSTNLFLSDTEYGHASAPITPVHTGHFNYNVGSSTGGQDQLVVNSGPSSLQGTPIHIVHPIRRNDPFFSSLNGSTHISCGPNHTGNSDSNELSSVSSTPNHNTMHTLQSQPVYDQVKDSDPKSWSLTKELFKLTKYGWYWGPITRPEAEEKLTDQQDGAFLVRDSSDDRYLLSLSFRSYGRTLHTRIEHCNGVFSFYAQPECEGYTSIVDLIDHSMTDSQSGVFCYSRARTPGSPSFPVRLTKPVSRFSQVRTLQYLCRFVIRQYTRFDHIQKLPLPPSIKGWLEENQY